MSHRRWLAAALLLSATSPLLANWPQFAGPARDAVSPETGLLKSWPADGPKVLWTVPLGEGFGAAAIDGQEVFVLDRTVPAATAKDVLRCLDLTTGRELWSYSYDAPGKIDFPGSRAVPTVTPNRVFICGALGALTCVDRQSHQALWNASVLEGPKAPQWGVAQSPLLYKNMVIVGAPRKSGGLLAFDQATGKQLWQCTDVTGTAYCSPKLFTLDGVDQVIIGHPKGVTSVNPESGKALWTFADFQLNLPIPSPTALSGNRIFITAGYNRGSVMLQVSHEGNAFSVNQLWRILHGTQIHQPLVVDDAIYMTGVPAVPGATTAPAGGGRGRKQAPATTMATSAPATAPAKSKECLMCFDAADGKMLWHSTPTEPEMDHATLLLADGRLYMQEATGDIALIQPSREGFKLISSTKALAGKTIWAPFALSDGKLIVRDQSQMKCLSVKANN